MTDDEMALLELLEKGADADLIRDMDTSDNRERCSGRVC
jgi:hypothetical protein